jgi:hypothetical protein
MAREVQEPTVTTENGGTAHERVVFRHPAFGQISAGRINGSTNLYGSDFKHQHFIRVRIQPSELHRSLSNDNYYSSLRPYIEVDMSEAQWATFVSSMNVGMGVPCTITEREGATLPALPAPPDRRDQFAGEARHRMQRAARRIEGLSAMIADSGLSKVKAKALLDELAAARADIGSNLQFVAGQFDEHMERTVESAKQEVNAYATNLVMRTGLQALAGPSNGAPALELTYAERKESP